MRLIAALALTALIAPGCFTLTSREVKERNSEFASQFEGEASKGKKIAVVALRVEKELKRDRWTRRKVAGAVEGLVLGLVPYPWDLRLAYSPGAIDKGTTFPAAAADQGATDRLAEELKERGMEPVALDAAAAASGTTISVAKLVEQAKAEGAAALYIVAFNEFVELRFKHGEDKSGDSILHEIYKLEGNVYVPSTAVFSDGGDRLLARAREHEKVFYAPMLTWGFRTDYSDDDDFDKQMEWLGKIAGTTPPQAAEKMAKYVVARDFFEGDEAEEPPTARRSRPRCPSGVDPPAASAVSAAPSWRLN
jgi:hypothetical protein